MEKQRFESKFTKNDRSKSYEPGSQAVDNPLSAKKDDDNAKKRLNELDKEKEKLQNQLRQSIKKNKELLAQLRAKKELEEKIEEEKNTTIELQMLVNVCKTEIEEAKENNGEHSHD